MTLWLRAYNYRIFDDSAFQKHTVDESSDYNKSSAIYDTVSIEYKPNDKKYIIYGVQGIIDFPNNIEGCYEKQDEIEKEISSMFDEIKKEDWGILIFDKEEGSTYRPIVYEDNKAKKKNWGILVLNLQGEAAEGSTYKPISFDFNTGDRISISCYHYSNTPQIDNLKITLTSKEFKEYLKEDAVPANN